jgi:hypothetical protein
MRGPTAFRTKRSCPRSQSQRPLLRGGPSTQATDTRRSPRTYSTGYLMALATDVRFGE